MVTRITKLVGPVILLLLSACGAPLKSADEVGDQYAASLSLGDKVLKLCQLLSSGADGPTLTGMDMDAARCKQAGLRAQNLSLNTKIYFSTSSEDGAVFSQSSDDGSDSSEMVLATRNEFWLNNSLLSLAQTLLPKIKEMKSSAIPKNAPSEQVEIRVVGESIFDERAQRLQMTVDFIGSKDKTGTVDLYNRFRIDGKVYEKKYIGVSVESVEDVPIETSLIKNGKVVLMVIPHAGDVYVDIVTKLTIHSFGVDKVVQQQFLDTLGSQFKKLSDIL